MDAKAYVVVTDGVPPRKRTASFLARARAVLVAINDSTKVPLSWVIGCAVAAAGVVLYVVDIRTQVAIVQAQSTSTAARMDSFESQWRDDMQAIRVELSRINDRLPSKPERK
jgi:hypothetical protein